jgi:hypothetical protein
MPHSFKCAHDFAASELYRLGPTAKAFLATDHEPMRQEVRQALGDR